MKYLSLVEAARQPHSPTRQGLNKLANAGRYGFLVRHEGKWMVKDGPEWRWYLNHRAMTRVRVRPLQDFYPGLAWDDDKLRALLSADLEEAVSQIDFQLPDWG